MTKIRRLAGDGWGESIRSDDHATTAGRGLSTRTTPLDPSALVWLVAGHGGAGTTTLAAMLAHAGDGGQQWPGNDDESPYAALVVRENMSGLQAAHDALVQVADPKRRPAGLVLAGVVLVAASHRKPGTRIKQRRALVEAICAEHDVPILRVGWHDYLLDNDPRDLPVCGPSTAIERKWDSRTRPPKDVITLGNTLADLVLTDLADDGR